MKEYLIKHAPHIVERMGDINRFFGYSGALDGETFVSIVDGWIAYYNQHRDQLAENLHKVFELTHGETGYDVFTKKWSDWEGRKPNRFDKEFCYSQLDEKFNGVICHFYQHHQPKSTYDVVSSGLGGLLLVARYTMSFHESEYKRVKHIVSSTLSLSIDIPCSHTEERDIYE